MAAVTPGTHGRGQPPARPAAAPARSAVPEPSGPARHVGPLGLPIRQRGLQQSVAVEIVTVFEQMDHGDIIQQAQAMPS